jgi:hypothetical protein
VHTVLILHSSLWSGGHACAETCIEQLAALDYPTTDYS